MENLPHPWEIGPFGLIWDAWVAIGTLLLAVVTAAAVWIPIYVERRQRLDRAEEDRKNVSIIAFSLKPEVSHIGFLVNEFRNQVITFHTGADWGAMKRGLQYLRTPILENIIEHISIFDYASAKDIIDVRFRLQNLKDLFVGEPENPEIFPNFFLATAIHVVTASAKCIKRLNGLSDTSGDIPLEWRVSELEQGVIKWVAKFPSTDMPPQWPID